jgi:DNA-binding HxlR family transcriptional regulator
MRAAIADEDWAEDCAPRRVLELFGSKWTTMVLHVLHRRWEGSARSGALLRSLPGVSKKMLFQTLREMEESGLVSRHEDAEAVPACVEYRLTPLGVRFVEPLEILYDWGRRNADVLDELRPRATSRRR